MNNSKNTLADKMKIDQEISDMRRHAIDYSDIPERSDNGTARLARQEFLDILPSDLIQEMARRRVKELQAAGYKIPEKVM